MKLKRELVPNLIVWSFSDVPCLLGRLICEGSIQFYGLNVAIRRFLHFLRLHQQKLHQELVQLASLYCAPSVLPGKIVSRESIPNSKGTTEPFISPPLIQSDSNWVSNWAFWSASFLTFSQSEHPSGRTEDDGVRVRCHNPPPHPQDPISPNSIYTLQLNNVRPNKLNPIATRPEEEESN